MVALELLQGLPFFVGLNEAQLRSLAIIANEVEFGRGHVVFEEDSPAHKLYLLLDGWVDIMMDTGVQGMRQELVTTCSAGDIFGWSAMVEPHVYTASVVCASSVRALEFKGTDLLALFEIDTRLCCMMTKRICQVIADRLHATRLQLVSLFVAH